MSNEVLVKVENVSKKFCRDLKRSLWYGVKDIAGEITGRNNPNRDLRPKEFWAVDDVSFELRRGECLGLIGRNGAGKTTLLRMLNGLIKPDKGRIEMRGRVGALIALGAGFNPILTGRENIYVNASVLGLSKKETDGKLEEIIDFAEIDEFIDSPVQTYSSGMQVRLGFAVATALEPDVLLLDEVLAVGDAGFRIKCYNRIAELKRNTAVVLVSHSMFDVSSVSTLGCVLNRGKVNYQGEINPAIDVYNALSDIQKYENTYTIGEISLNVFKMLEDEVGWDSSPSFLIDFSSQALVKDVFIRLMITDIGGGVVGEWNSKKHNQFFEINKGHNEITFKVENLRLRNDKYYVNLVVTKGSGREYLINLRQTVSFLVTGGIYTSSYYVI